MNPVANSPVKDFINKTEQNIVLKKRDINNTFELYIKTGSISDPDLNTRLITCWLKAQQLRNESKVSQGKQKIDQLTKDVACLNEVLNAGNARLDETARTLKTTQESLAKSEESLRQLQVDINLKENLAIVEAARARLYWDMKTEGVLGGLGFSCIPLFLAIGTGPIGWSIAGTIIFGVNKMIYGEFKDWVAKVDRISKDVLSKPSLEKVEVQKKLKEAIPHLYK